MNISGGIDPETNLARSKSAHRRRKSSCYTTMLPAAGSPHGTPRPPCTSRPVWHVASVGFMCHFHFEQYFDSHPELDVNNITRLSDNDRYFAGRGEPGSHWRHSVRLRFPTGKTSRSSDSDGDTDTAISPINDQEASA